MPKFIKPSLILRFPQGKKRSQRNSILVWVFTAIHLTQQIKNTVMKTKMIYLCMAFLLITNVVRAETIAVTNFNCSGLFVTPELAAKMARLELVKLEKYTVLDEFDMSEVLAQNPQYGTCYGKTCLIEIGEKLKVDYIMSGSIDGLGNKIVVTIKLIDVNNKVLKTTKSLEFDNQEAELQRMIGIVIQEMLGAPVDAITKTLLEFKNEMITSNNVGRMNNSGPRIGASYVAFGEMNEFFMRNEARGGLGCLPMMSNFGYQFEEQYIGTENFSALAELIFNVGGMEQGNFIPSLALLNGFRFGEGGWEFAFGPSIGFRKTSKGHFENGIYYTSSEYGSLNPAANQTIYKRHLDARGDIEFSANWVMAFGRTFKSGALNIPLNLYYSSNKYGGVIGASIGFNVNKSKTNINKP